MDYDLNDPNLDFAGRAEIIARALKRNQALQNTDMPEPLIGAPGGVRYMANGPAGAIGAFLSRAAGQVGTGQNEAEQLKLNAEENKRYHALSQAMAQQGTKQVPAFTKALNPEGAPLGLVDQNSEETKTVPLDPIAENNRRMGIATEMTMLPQAKAVGNMYLQQGAAFPEKIAQMKEKAETSLKELALRLEDKGLDRNTRIMLASQMDDTKRYLGELAAATSRGNAQLSASMKQLANANKPDGKPLGDTESKDLMQYTDMAKQLKQLHGDFKPDMAGYGAAGDIARKLAGYAGSWAPDDVQAANKWWAAYEQLAELPIRNKIFGAALTPHEQALWNQARMLKPGDTPESVKAAALQLSNIMQSKADRMGSAAVAGGKSPSAVKALTGKDPSTGAGIPVYNRETGKFE